MSILIQLNLIQPQPAYETHWHSITCVKMPQELDAF